MTDTRKNIKVSPERFEQLKADKPPDASWGYYLAEIRTVDAEGGDAGDE